MKEKVTKCIRQKKFIYSILFAGLFLTVSSCSDSGTGNSPDDPEKVSKIELNIESAYIGVEDEIQPEVKVLGQSGQPLTGQSVKWSSDNESVASVSSGGVITGESAGNTIIRIESGGVSTSLSVEVFQGKGHSSLEFMKIDMAVMDYMKQEGIPGASVAVVKDGRLVHVRGYGFADPETNKVAEPSTVFRYGSVSKPITSIATMKLVEEGKLSLDDKAFQMLSDLPVRPGESEDPRLKTITLEQLMTHSGGWNENRNVDGAVWQAVSQHGVRDNGQMFRYGRSIALASDPGTEYAYTNYATQTTGLLIEKVTGTDYETWVQENIFEPIGIQTVKFGETALEDRDPNEARYHRADGYRPDIDDGAMDYYGASGSWVGRAVDLVRLADAAEGRGGLSPILQQSTIDMMTARPDFYPQTGGYYAKFWQILPSGNDKYWYHAGIADGAFSYLWRMPDGVSYAILLNRTPPGSRPDLRNVLEAITTWPEANYYSEFYSE